MIKKKENMINIPVNITCVVESIPFIYNDIFKKIRDNLCDLEVGKCLTITNNKDTGLNITELQKRISSIACNHKKKYVEKEFCSKKINKNSIRIWRIK